MKSCCDEKQFVLAQLKNQQGHVLKIVLVINALMFLIEGTAGLIANSTSLMGDSLDMLGDAAVYGFSLYVLHKSAIWHARAALVKGIIMFLLGTGVLAEAVIKSFSSLLPVPETMGGIGFLALCANGACLILLLRHRNDDINMKSTWTCSRNDIIGNTGVIFASALVNLTHSKWPDILLGSGMAILFLSSVLVILKESFKELKRLRV